MVTFQVAAGSGRDWCAALGGGADLAGDARRVPGPSPFCYVPQHLADGYDEHDNQAEMHAGVDGGDGVGRHGAAAEVGLADIVVCAQQEGNDADAEQVEQGFDDVVVAAHRAKEQRNLRGNLDTEESNDDPVEGAPDSGQIDVEQMQGDVGTEHQYGEMREGEQPGEEQRAGDDVSIRMARAVPIRKGIRFG